MKNDAGKFLADVKRVVLKGEERYNEVDESTTGIEFKDLARDAAEVAKGIFGEVSTNSMYRLNSRSKFAYMKAVVLSAAVPPCNAVFCAG